MTNRSVRVASFFYAEGVAAGLRLPALDERTQGVVTAVQGREVFVRFYSDVDALTSIMTGCLCALSDGLTTMAPGKIIIFSKI